MELLNLTSTEVSALALGVAALREELRAEGFCADTKRDAELASLSEKLDRLFLEKLNAQL